MQMKLIVLAGAKEGTVIPLKKSKFSIGRSKECTLRAGNEAISRRHCEITRADSVWTVADMGSRNGTYVNGERIGEPTELGDGDELRVGPLHFRVSLAESVKSADAEPSKQRKAKDAAAEPQASETDDDSSIEEDISRWLSGGGDSSEQALKETRTLSIEDTSQVEVKADKPDKDQTEDDDTTADSQDEASDNVEEKKSKAWFGLGGKDKKGPGKLPKGGARGQESRDSREAAADILREMTRRR